MKRTKIICTIGPASQEVKTIKTMIKNGMNVARLNFSHGSHENHALLINNIRTASKQLKQPIAIIADLQGPKIRITALSKSLKIKPGQKILIGEDFNLDFDISRSVKPKDRILIEDGLIELRVKAVKNSYIICQAINGGEIKEHKGINLPDSDIKFPIITKKDLLDLKFALAYDVDYIALSFVREGRDVTNLKSLIAKYNPKDKQLPQVIAKIERRSALDNFDKILNIADGIMIARGDLGVEIADTDVPLVQKDLIKKCIKAAKPVIVATQMLDSMIRNPRPTRAEVSDVANAVIDQADCVMLSGETAYGAYPVESVNEMNRIIEATEESAYVRIEHKYEGSDEQGFRASLIAEAVDKLAEGVDAKAIIGTTESGYTARFITHHRPEVPVIIMTDKYKIYSQLTLIWGVEPIYIKSFSELKNVEGLLKQFVSEAKKKKLVKAGNKVVLVAGNPLGQRMNLVQALQIK